MDQVEAFVNALNGLFFSNIVVYILLFAGVMFTVWSFFGQWRALTHGVAIVRGKYDDKDDPGAINHFQALSAALSATVGLGNIGGVAAAVALGGPGAVFWMWVIGAIGMALKMTEVTQAMLTRDTSDPSEPHGGPMYVVKRMLAPDAPNSRRLGIIAGLAFAGVAVGLAFMSGSLTALAVCGVLGVVMIALGFTRAAMLGGLIGGIFCLTLILSAITGGNMFQSWNVTEVTTEYINVPRPAIGVILAVVVGVVIIGGIKRIGAVAGRLVPFMCALYLLAAAYVVLFKSLDQVPGMFALIVRAGLGFEEQSATGAFLGGTFGYAALFGIKRALFSSEAGQGSAPIAHSAAKTDEPVREGVVAGIEPFIDTIVVCTLTALVIISSGAWNRGPEGSWDRPVALVSSAVALDESGALLEGRVVETDEGWFEIVHVRDNLGLLTPERTRITDTDEARATLEEVRQAELARVLGRNLAELAGGAAPAAEADTLAADVAAFASTQGTSPEQATAERLAELVGRYDALAASAPDVPLRPIDELREPSAAPYLVIPDRFVPDVDTAPTRNAEARSIREAWKENSTVFVLVRDDLDEKQTGTDLDRLFGKIGRQVVTDAEGEERSRPYVAWRPFASDEVRPTLVADPEAAPGDFAVVGLYGDYVGASLTAHAFDRAEPGLGMWLIVFASWLFAVSTMISWSYYGEQGIYFLFGKNATAAVLVYKLLYCLLVFVSSLPFIKTEQELDMWTTLGLGAMLVVNIPIMLIFGYRAMGAYHEYMGRLRRGEFAAEAHKPAPLSDVVEGKDV